MKEKGKVLEVEGWSDDNNETAESYFVVFQQLIHGMIQMMKKKH